MSDCSPLKLAENDQSSPSQSLGSQNSNGEHPRASHHINGGDEMRYSEHDNHHNQVDQQRHRSQSESSSKSGQLRYGARNVIELFIPVSICMLIVVGTMKATDSYQYSSQSIIWYAQMMYTDQSVGTGTRVWQSFANAFMMLLLIVVMTTVLILLYKFRCYATIHGWLISSSLMLLSIFALMYIEEILKAYNIPMDNYTLTIFIWNFGAVGMICIHWKGPLLLQQAYLITISSVMALLFIRCLPDWTIWTVLIIVSFWDVFAVLCPGGPLRILVELAQERNESIFPALIYSSTMVWEAIISTTIVSTYPSISMAENKSSKSNRNNGRGNRQKGDGRRNHQQLTNSAPSSSRHANRNEMVSSVKREQHPVEIHYEDGAQPPEVAFIQPTLSSSSGMGENWERNPVVAAIRERRSIPQESGVEQAREATTTELSINFQGQDSRVDSLVEEERGVKLGLGDFIFFSVLVGKASSYGDWTITMSCYVAILVGLCFTLSLLAIFRKALPALPISIAFGLCSFFLSYMFVVPFAEELSTNQIFI